MEEHQLSKLKGQYIVMNDGCFLQEWNIDYLLLAPNGLFLIKKLELEGTIEGTDTQREWSHFAKQDVTKILNPIKQVSHQVYQLTQYLKEHQINVTVEGIVYVSNPETDVHIKRSSTKIPIITNLKSQPSLYDYITNYSGYLSNGHKEQIMELLN